MMGNEDGLVFMAVGDLHRTHKTEWTREKKNLSPVKCEPRDLLSSFMTWKISPMAISKLMHIHGTSYLFCENHECDFLSYEVILFEK